jgi:hypothetical protein
MAGHGSAHWRGERGGRRGGEVGAARGALGGDVGRGRQAAMEGRSHRLLLCLVSLLYMRRKQEE